MLTEYVNAAMRKARYEVLSDGSHFGRIPGLQGVWADGKTRRACQKELKEVLEDWLVVKLRDRDRLPRINGIALVTPSLARRGKIGFGSTKRTPKRAAGGAKVRRLAGTR